MQSLLRLGVAAFLTLAAASPTLAQNRTLTELRAEIDELKGQVAKLSAQTPTLSGSVTDLTTRLGQLEQRLDTVERQRQAVPEAIEKMDELDAHTRALRADVEALVTRVGELEQPSQTSGGGGVRYDNGFGWTSEDGKYSLKVGGLIQFRVMDIVEEDGLGDLSHAENTYQFSRTRVVAKGSAPLGTFFLQMDPRLDPVMLDYFFRVAVPSWTSAARFALKVGQDRNMYTRNWRVLGGDLLFAERPAAVGDFRYDRSPGIGLETWALDDRVYGYLGASNGNGLGRVNDNLDMAIFARAEVAVLGKRPARSTYVDIARSSDPVLVLGAGGVHDLAAVPVTLGGLEVGQRDVDGDGRVDNVRVLSASADLLFRWQGWEFAGEWLFRREDWGSIFDHPDNESIGDLFEFDSKRNYMGLYGDLSYALNSELVFGGRVGHHRQLTFLTDGRLRSTSPKSRRLLEAAAVAAYYWGPSNRRFASLEVSYFNHNNQDQTEVPDDETLRAILELQFQW